MIVNVPAASDVLEMTEAFVTVHVPAPSAVVSYVTVSPGRTHCEPVIVGKPFTVTVVVLLQPLKSV